MFMSGSISIRDVVTIRKASKGDSLRFLISPSVQDALNLNFGDTVQILINKITIDEKSTTINPYPMVGTVIKAGGTSKGVTIKKEIVKLLNLKVDQMIEIDIQKHPLANPFVHNIYWHLHQTQYFKFSNNVRL